MGNVINVLVHIDTADSIDKLNVELHRHDMHILGDIVDHVDGKEVRWGGPKYPEVELFGAAYNGLNVEQFVNCVRNTSWQRPENVQIFIKRENDKVFEVITLRER